jgi:hypothetical protein
MDAAATFFRRFALTRSRTALAVDDLLARVSPDDPERIELAARARKHSRDCGCAMGGAFLAIATLLALAYFAATLDVSVRGVFAGVLFVLVATLLGKLIGLLLAWVRLARLYRSLSRRLQRGSDHVYVH